MSPFWLYFFSCKNKKNKKEFHFFIFTERNAETKNFIFYETNILNIQAKGKSLGYSQNIIFTTKSIFQQIENY